MTQEQTFEIYTYSVVHDPEEPRWAETGIPDIYFASFEEAKAEVTRLRADLGANGEEALPPSSRTTKSWKPWVDGGGPVASRGPVSGIPAVTITSKQRSTAPG